MERYLYFNALYKIRWSFEQWVSLVANKANRCAWCVAICASAQDAPERRSNGNFYKWVTDRPTNRPTYGGA